MESGFGGVVKIREPNCVHGRVCPFIVVHGDLNKQKLRSSVSTVLISVMPIRTIPMEGEKF